MTLIDLAERGLLPDFVIRYGIRRTCTQRLLEEHSGSAQVVADRQKLRVEGLRQSPIAIETQAANDQHYELPPAFFNLCLGQHKKYSSCYFERGDESLDQAEALMLAMYCERADLQDGQHILELGCGWGSLTLWMASKFPNAQITAISNSKPQREYIETQCRERNLNNVKIITCDVNLLELTANQFERVISIEMFEHMKNYQQLLARIGFWLKPEGKLFVHIFCHKELLYPFETEGDDNWMGRYFFTGGQMPAFDTLSQFQDDLKLLQSWRVSGMHYARTANAWLHNQDKHADAIMQILRPVYGDKAKIWYQRWRMFWMACAELFAYNDGEEWLVGHYIFAKQKTNATAS